MLHSPLPLLLAAFSIIYSSHGDEMCSLNQPESIVFIFNDTTGLLNCSVSGQPNMICMDDNQIANGTHLVLGNNEGVYKCCCDCANSGGNCTDPLTLYAPLDSLLNDTIPRTVEHVWGVPVKIQCPYVPGLLANMGYKLRWGLSSPTLEISRADLFFEIDISTNQLVLKQFSSLFDGVFSCRLSSNDRQLPEDEFVTVKTTPNQTNVVAITQAPAQTLVMINDKASFQCTATVRSNESMGFRIIDPINNEVVKNMNITNSQCTLQGDDNVFTSLSCIEDKNRYKLLCDYSIPYEIKCDLQILINLKVNESSFVECFVFDEKMETVVKSTTGLFVKPDPFPEPVITTTYNGSNTIIAFNLLLNYPLTFPVIIQIIINDQQQYNETAMMSNNNKQLQANFIVTDITEMAAQYKIFSEDSNIMITDSTFTLNITSIASTSSMISSSAATVSSTSTVEPSPTVQNQNVLSKEAISGIGGGIALLVLCTLLVGIIITILLLNRKLNKRKMKYERPSEEECNCPCPTESNELRPVGYMSHLSPRSDTYSQSQVSTIDTYIEEVSPRRHPPSQSSHSSHTHSSSSCPSTRNLRQKPLPRYGIPDHYPQYPNSPQYSLPLAGGTPQITLIAPTPTMENQPVLGDYPDCLSPTGTEPFSPNEEKTELFSNPTKENTQNRPNDLPIGSPPQRNETGTTPLSDQTMIGVLLYLQHKDCDRRSNCKTCKLIDRHFERIANKYGDSTLTGIIKNLNTPGADGTLKHLRKREKREKQRIRSPHKQQVAPLGVTMYKRQRSHSASHIDDEELTFSSTETDEDSLKPSNRRFKALHNKSRKAVTDDERDVYDYNLLPLQRISEGISLSQHDIPTTPIDLASFSHLPGKSTVGKGSETDSTDGSMSSRCESNPRFDGSKGSGLSASYMKSPDVEQTLPPGFMYKPPVFKTTNSTSGYETDNVFYHDRTISSSSDSTTNDLRHPQSLKGPPSYSQVNGLPIHQQSRNGQHTEYNGQRSVPNYSYNDGRQVYSDDNCSLQSASLSHKSQHHHQTSQSDYLKIASRQRSHENKSNLSLNNSGVLSMHSSPDHGQYYRRYTSNGSNGSNGSNHSNHSVHSESAALNYHPRTNHKHQFYSPPQQRRNKDVRTPSPFPLVLPSEDSSSTPI